MKDYPETHQQGTIFLENRELFPETYFKGDLGFQVARDGRVWVCINGIAFLRFSPHADGEVQPASRISPPAWASFWKWAKQHIRAKNHAWECRYCKMMIGNGQPAVREHFLSCTKWPESEGNHG